MKSKHTQGPWKFVCISQPGGHPSVPGVISESGACLTSHVTLEDAHLIAAAPEMLEMLKAVEEYFRQYEVGTGWESNNWPVIKNIIAKAEGDSK